MLTSHHSCNQPIEQIADEQEAAVDDEGLVKETWTQAQSISHQTSGTFDADPKRNLLNINKTSNRL